MITVDPVSLKLCLYTTYLFGMVETMSPVEQ